MFQYAPVQKDNNIENTNGIINLKIKITKSLVELVRYFLEKKYVRDETRP